MDAARLLGVLLLVKVIEHTVQGYQAGGDEEDEQEDNRIAYHLAILLCTFSTLASERYVT